ncbi:PID-CTERM protein-sorting domain-containing protein [Hymenobacter sp. BT559]|jgi:hypothetical protein|uniref:PID-CTERM protein-sorting domain-containing protein n=1 Tax=Hymenobacter sp. BT559 TaxID=2795729 RepID=UPI0018EBA6C7|nr:hypothetical protein [Hymenobacter sp. BT559]MBJ6145064.1 hypothetical protein [Hymenobacter sp. BT559]
MNKISSLRLALAAAGLWLLTGALAATQAQTPTTGGPVPQAPDPAAVPLDGGASLLVAAGVGFGLRKLRRLRQSS